MTESHPHLTSYQTFKDHLSKKYQTEGSLIENTSTGHDLMIRLIHASHDLAERLYEHCGPFASNAVLPSRSSLDSTIDQYTKDGISIIKQFKTNDIAFEHIRRLAEYVGERVDSTCHDGTTTAMMLFTSLAQCWLVEAMRHHEKYGISQGWRLVKDAEQLLSTIDQVVRDNTYSMDSLLQKILTVDPTVTSQKLQYAVAYHQAFIASKGDEELARGIAEVLSHIPMEQYGQYVYNRFRHETEERFTVETQEHDFEVMANLVIASQNNHALKTQLKLDDCYLIICSDRITAGMQTASLALHALLDPESADRAFFGLDQITGPLDKPLVILSPELNDQGLASKIYKYNQDHPETQIYPINVSLKSIKLHSSFAAGLAGMASSVDLATVGFTPIQPAIISGVKIHHALHTLRIYNLYPKTGEVLHPLYQNPDEFLPYTRTLTEIQRLIEESVTNHVPPLTNDELSFMITLRRAMTCQKIVDLRIGGSTHEVVANESVVNDAFGSAVSALEKGIIFGGHFLIFDALTVPADKAMNDRGYLLFNDLHAATMDALAVVLNAIYRFDDPYQLQSCLELLRASNTTTAYLAVDFRSGLRMVQSLSDPDTVRKFLACDRSHPVLVQPAAGYYEQIKRFHELLPKLVNTTCLVDLDYRPVMKL